MFWGRKEKELNSLSNEDEDERDAVPTTRGFEDEIERRDLKWWEYLIYKKEVRIFYLVLSCVGLVVCVPSILDYEGFFPIEYTVEAIATCGVKDNFRIDCLPDKPGGTMEDCLSRKCCWDTQNENGEACYHRLPSPNNMVYALYGRNDGKVGGKGYNDEEISAEYRASSDGTGHAMFELGTNVSPGLSGSEGSGVDPLDIVVSCPDEDDCINQILTVNVRLGIVKDAKSVARTHFGPLVYSRKLSEISFYLPTNILFAKDFKNFVYNGSQEVSYFSFGDNSQVHLPVVLGMHSDQVWYLLYLETDQPGSQTVTGGSGDQPILTWRFMGGNIKVHFFIADSPAELLKKFNNYIYSGQPGIIQPFSEGIWKYGFHLCRQTTNPDSFLQDISEMKKNNLPFDSDCIDELVMPTFFNLDSQFDLTAVQDTRLTLPLPVQMLVSDADPPLSCVQINSTSAECYKGMFNKNSVYFPDVYNSSFASLLESKYVHFQDIPKDEVYLHDIAPTDQFDWINRPVCLEPDYIPKGLSFSHLACLTGWIPAESTAMYNRHAGYARRVLQVASEVLTATASIKSDVVMVGIPRTITFTGSKVPASWEGMRSSLQEVLLLSLLGIPSVSMPACGTQFVNTSDSDLMCLRWIQLASFMPGMHSWYSGSERERVPYMLPKSYQKYTRWAIEERYKLLPYFKTLAREWSEHQLPWIRPMMFKVPDKSFAHLYTQFFVGDSILVAPVLFSSVEIVDITFPEGSWYLLGSWSPVNVPHGGATVPFHSKPYEIPAFIRGGSVIVFHETAGDSIVKTEEKPFLISVGLDCNQLPKMNNCTAVGVSYLNTEDNKLTVNAKTLSAEGEIALTVSGTLNGDLNKIGSVVVSGLREMGKELVITLPGGNTVTATDTLDTAVSGPAAVYERDRQILYLRNLEMDTLDSKINWTFS